VDVTDVIISIAGSIGLVACVPEELAGANLTENAAKIVPRRAGEYSPRWLAAALRSPSLQSQIRSHVGQVTIGKLALFRIEKLELTLPPLELQRRFLRQVESISDLRTTQVVAKKTEEELRSSLRERAFSGSL
jgi:restriction endonuclease S subunit